MLDFDRIHVHGAIEHLWMVRIVENIRRQCTRRSWQNWKHREYHCRTCGCPHWESYNKNNADHWPGFGWLENFWYYFNKLYDRVYLNKLYDKQYEYSSFIEYTFEHKLIQGKYAAAPTLPLTAVLQLAINIRQFSVYPLHCTFWRFSKHFL